jgi:hypothetical protein
LAGCAATGAGAWAVAMGRVSALTANPPTKVDAKIDAKNKDRIFSIGYLV